MRIRCEECTPLSLTELSVYSRLFGLLVHFGKHMHIVVFHYTILC